MARVKCRVVFKKFKPNKPGYAAVMNAGAVQSILRQHAERTKSAAEAALGADGYTSAEGYKIGTAHGKLANGYYVNTHTLHAKRDNALYNTLGQALR